MLDLVFSSSHSIHIYGGKNKNFLKTPNPKKKKPKTTPKPKKPPQPKQPNKQTPPKKQKPKTNQQRMCSFQDHNLFFLSVIRYRSLFQPI